MSELTYALRKICFMFSEACGTYKTYKLVLGFPDLKTMQDAQEAICDAVEQSQKKARA